MVKKYPDFQRGESASETGRAHIPTKLFKEAVYLNRLKEQIVAIGSDTNLLDKKTKNEELEALLDKYIPGVEAMRTKLKKHDKAYKELAAEHVELEKKLHKSRESTLQKLEINRQLVKLEELHRTVAELPPEVLQSVEKIMEYKSQER